MDTWRDWAQGPTGAEGAAAELVVKDPDSQPRRYPYSHVLLQLRVCYRRQLIMVCGQGEKMGPDLRVWQGQWRSQESPSAEVSTDRVSAELCRPAVHTCLSTSRPPSFTPQLEASFT